MSKGRPKYKKRELHAEVVKILLGDGYPPSEAQWKFSAKVLGKAIHPSLVSLYIGVQQGLKADFSSLAKTVSERCKNLPFFRIELSEQELFDDISESFQEDVTRLKNAFTAAVICEDETFLEDLAFITVLFKEQPSKREEFWEYTHYYRAVMELKIQKKSITAGEVRKVLAANGFSQDLDTIRNILSRQFGLL